MVKGTIFDIKRFAVHDGPGIRSTLFFKGCPLKCLWCHNPEGIGLCPALWYFPTKCIGCRLCLEACPEDSLSVQGEDPFYIAIDKKSCTSCGKCVQVCPTGALEFDGKEIDHTEVIAELLKDRSFFEESKGGVTLSGGDPVLQPEFAFQILGELKAEGIHTVLESALFCSPEVLEQFIPLVDLFLADFKVFSDELHRKFTGVSNLTIIRNITYLLHSGKEVLIRIPLIPLHTATNENLTAIADFLKSTGVPVKCELLNYNPLAVSKYRLLNIDNKAIEGLKPFSIEQIKTWEEIIASRGIEIVSENQ
ncbi:MAG: glycyl-radical enzyme activating protein [Spirochaetales bacterium]|nr:glycyl-radical enzyme activating protein [Spirochaetales bacterium]